MPSRPSRLYRHRRSNFNDQDSSISFSLSVCIICVLHLWVWSLGVTEAPVQASSFFHREVNNYKCCNSPFERQLAVAEADAQLLEFLHLLYDLQQQQQLEQQQRAASSQHTLKEGGGVATSSAGGGTHFVTNIGGSSSSKLFAHQAIQTCFLIDRHSNIDDDNDNNKNNFAFSSL